MTKILVVHQRMFKVAVRYSTVLKHYRKLGSKLVVIANTTVYKIVGKDFIDYLGQQKV